MGGLLSSEGPAAIDQRSHGKTLVLFDVDGTLTVPAQVIEKEMLETLARLRKDYAVGIVGAADFEKIQRQLGGNVHDKVDFVFAESGVHAFRDSKLIHQKSIAEHLGPERWSAFKTGLDSILESEKDARQKCLECTRPGCSLSERETFLEERVCTINITPIGRNPGLTKDERYACEKADKEDGLRLRVLEAVHKQFGPSTEYQLHANIGGQIGVDVGVVGWDKTFALQFLSEAEFATLHFFGDKCEPGGGDYEIYSHKRTEGHAVATWEDTNKQLKELFLA
jgi:phosphomannomutase